MAEGNRAGGARAGGVAALVVALVVAGGCGVVEDEYTGNAAGPKVAVLGDSIGYSAVDEIHAALDPDHLVRIHAITGITFSASHARAVEFAATDPDVVVVELGTNDVWTNIPPATMVGDMDALLATFPDACVVMATVNEHTVGAVSGSGVLYDNAAAHELNEAIRSRTAHLVDWDAAANAEPARLLDGGSVHATPEGELLLASLIEEQVESCTAGTS